MSKPFAIRVSDKSMMILSHLLLSPRQADGTLSSFPPSLRDVSLDDFNALVKLAHSNHVIVRSLRIFHDVVLGAQDHVRSEWAANALADEHARIVKAMGFMQLIRDAFEEEGLDLTVMKSLDHWPDFGSDLDVYTNSPSRAVCALMQRRFDAQIATRSWGDRLACKWNFLIPGLPEPLEVHTGRLGQTGEQLVLASRLPARARLIEIEGQTFRVPSASDRLMVSTLQRMYRHFYFRLCDIVDSAELADSGAIDYDDLQASARTAGIWEGVATYLVIVSDYVRNYRGRGIELPPFVMDSARFNGDVVCFGKNFLRVPIIPQSAGLYGSQFAGLLRRRELHGTMRLGLLPWLATAAAVGQKFTGSDKGIW
jgi:hypothetical protein